MAHLLHLPQKLYRRTEPHLLGCQVFKPRIDLLAQPIALLCSSASQASSHHSIAPCWVAASAHPHSVQPLAASVTRRCGHFVSLPSVPQTYSQFSVPTTNSITQIRKGQPPLAKPRVLHASLFTARNAGWSDGGQLPCSLGSAIHERQPPANAKAAGCTGKIIHTLRTSQRAGQIALT